MNTPIFTFKTSISTYNLQYSADCTDLQLCVHTAVHTHTHMIHTGVHSCSFSNVVNVHTCAHTAIPSYTIRILECTLKFITQIMYYPVDLDLLQ
jgi:hypothetical protein